MSEFIDKEITYDIALAGMNIFLGMGIFFTITNIIIPLFSGNFSWHAIMAYSSWIMMALVGKFSIKKARKGQLEKLHFILISLAVVVNCIIWFKYPYNIIFSLIAVLGNSYSYSYIKKKKLDSSLRSE